MKAILTALLSGTLFGAGLSVSQMTNPAKVIGFLDITGSWDPSLAFVMGTALVVSAIAVRVERMAHIDPTAPRPMESATTGIDRRLLVGACLFGLGWGLAGFCPGPALAGLVSGSGQLVLFVGAMLAGMGLFNLLPSQPTGPA